MNTFEHVVRNYGMIKPVVSCNHTLEDDVRPLERRANTHIRIVRESLTKYSLNDRCYKGAKPKDPQLTWFRSKKGEFLTVRLTYDDSIFADGHLPSGISLYADGKGNRVLRFIGANGVMETIVPYHNYRGHSRYIVRADNTAGFKEVKNTGVTLERHERNPDYVPSGLYDTSNHYWELVSKPYLKRVTRTLVDKAAKAKIKPVMNAFYEWFLIMAPLIHGTQWGYPSVDMGAILASKNSMVDIMADENNPHRVTVVKMILVTGVGALGSMSQKEIRTMFNTWINGNTGVTYETTTYEEV